MIYKVAGKLYERDSLIIFDEVQMYSKARAAIKYLVANGKYDYVPYVIHYQDLKEEENIIYLPIYMVPML